MAVWPDYDMHTVSIIIPCRNEETFIERCLDSLLANDYPHNRLEIIVADGRSRDHTRAIAERYARRHSLIRVMDNPDGTIPAAMNLGIRRSRGQIIMKVDAHSTYPSNYVSECVRHLACSEAGMVGGICSISPRNETVMSRTIAVALSHWFASGNAYIKTGSPELRWADAVAFGCWERETLEKLGPFDERLVRSSDMEYNVRLRKSGKKILLVPRIQVTYYADADLKSFWRHNFNDGLWTTYVLKFGKWASAWRHWIPLGFLLSLLASGLAAPFYASAGWASGGIGTAYLLVNLTAAVQVCVQRRDWSSMGLLPIVFATRHVGHGCGALYGLLLAALPSGSVSPITSSTTSSPP